jgi:hypothetical protein
MAGHNPPWAWCFRRFGIHLHGMCIVLQFLFFPDSRVGQSFQRRPATKSLLVIYLSRGAIKLTRLSSFGAASASVRGNKEAANSSNMTFTRIDSPRHYPNRSGRRNGPLHRLS